MSTAGSRPEPEIIPPGQEQGFHHSSGQRPGELGDSMTWPRAGYLLYAIAIFTAVPMLVGLILAYVMRGEAPPWQQTHYTFLIRTFWYSIALAVIGTVLIVAFGLGLLVLWALPIWVGIRVLRGWVLLENRHAVPQPESWLFG